MSGDLVRWRSRAVDLRLLGTAGSLMTLLAGCSGATYQRNVYKDTSGCTADYSATVCVQQGQQMADRFLGPTYRVKSGQPSPCTSRDPGAGSFMSRRIGVEPTVRGGFACDRSSSRRRRYTTSGRSWSFGG